MNEEPLSVKNPPEQAPAPHLAEAPQSAPIPVDNPPEPPKHAEVPLQTNPIPITQPKTDHSVTTAIIATVVIVITLSALAVFAYLNQK